jgi:hypothetical protein
VRSNNPDRIFRDIESSMERAVDDLLQDINRDVKVQTPKRTGYASRQWRYSNPYVLGYTGTVIENRASYIALLDNGYSKQAPRGIVDPVIQKLQRRKRRL